LLALLLRCELAPYSGELSCVKPEVGAPGTLVDFPEVRHADSRDSRRTLEGEHPVGLCSKPRYVGGCRPSAIDDCRAVLCRPRASAQPFQTYTGTWWSLTLLNSSRMGGTPTPSMR
jgi:hypothetical protein